MRFLLIKRVCFILQVQKVYLKYCRIIDFCLVLYQSFFRFLIRLSFRGFKKMICSKFLNGGIEIKVFEIKTQ